MAKLFSVSALQFLWLSSIKKAEKGWSEYDHPGVREF